MSLLTKAFTRSVEQAVPLAEAGKLPYLLFPPKRIPVTGISRRAMNLKRGLKLIRSRKSLIQKQPRAILKMAVTSGIAACSCLGPVDTWMS